MFPPQVRLYTLKVHYPKSGPVDSSSVAKLENQSTAETPLGVRKRIFPKFLCYLRGFPFMQKPRWFVGVMLVTIFAITIAAILHSGSFLVVANVHRADAILVLAGDVNDRRYQKGIELLGQDYGQQLLVDASEDVTLYGNTYAEWARRFLLENPTEVRDRVRVCPIREDSTAAETKYAAKCLSYLPPGSTILLVTSDYHSRRALSVFTNRLPSYRW